MNGLLEKVQASGQDFEWYPTTREILRAVYKDTRDIRVQGGRRGFSLLDCGAGDGKVFRVLEELHAEELANVTDDDERRRWENWPYTITKYAIEKSRPLIEALPNDVFIVGTEFHDQSLIDKKVDIVFANPPYSEYQEWTEKILRETPAETVYLVIPVRWEDNQQIAAAIDRRAAHHRVLGDFDFERSEDRRARARVQLVRFDLGTRNKYDPFSIWFDEHFRIDVSEKRDRISEHQRTQEVKQELISTRNFIPDLVRMYNQELDDLLGNYQALGSLDPDLLEELSVSLEGLKEALKLKIEGLKNVYWQVLFDRLTSVTERLTKKSREEMLRTLTQHTAVDFTESNILAVVLWVVKNANRYFDSQLLEVYSRLTEKECIRAYASNTRIVVDDWRYLKSEMTHYALDYRIVTHCYDNFDGYEYDKRNGIRSSTYDTIADVFVVASNLGIGVHPRDLVLVQWSPGTKNEFRDQDGRLFVDIRAYRNGNVHFRFSPDFMRRLNVEAARLNGWVKSPREAAEEIGISPEEAADAFGRNLNLRAETALPFLEPIEEAKS
ncbi:MAG: DUF4942 domain-containing protein [Alkalispirochaeta sp.]